MRYISIGEIKSRLYIMLLAVSMILVSGAVGVKAEPVPEECLHENLLLQGYTKAVSHIEGTADDSWTDGYTGDMVCETCGEIIEEGKPIAAAVKVTAPSLTYNGKSQKPEVTVTDSQGEILDPDNYTVKYSNNKKVGPATITVILQKDYEGKVKGIFNIIPKNTSQIKVTAKRKGFALCWKSLGKDVSGYQIEYSTKKDFSKAVRVKKKGDKTYARISKLKAQKKYYVRVRSYKLVSGKYYFSKWSKAKTVKTCRYLITIDAGHQKRQNSGLEPIGPGASTKKLKVAGGAKGVSTGQYEYALNLTIALKLQKELEKRGYEVVMVRTHHDVDIPNSQRAKIANDAKSNAFVRIHANGSVSSSTNGAQTICMTKNNPYNAELYEESYRLSKCILDKYCKKTGCRKEFVSRVDNMSGINWCKVPVTIIEMGYLSNPEEDRKMATSSYQKKMTIGIADGIDAYFKK